jgi:hypothetical protein
MILSPTFREEQDLEKQEAFTEREQAKDLVSRDLYWCVIYTNVL